MAMFSLAAINWSTAPASNFTTLNLSNNNLSDGDIDGLWSCAGIKHVDLSSNALKIVPETVQRLVALQTLDLRNNQLHTVHHSIATLLQRPHSELSIHLTGNSGLLVPPPQVVADGPHGIREFYVGLEDGSATCWTQMVNVFGPSGAGKTSICNALQHGICCSDEPPRSGTEQKHGASLEVRTWTTVFGAHTRRQSREMYARVQSPITVQFRRRMLYGTARQCITHLKGNMLTFDFPGVARTYALDDRVTVSVTREESKHVVELLNVPTRVIQNIMEIRSFSEASSSVSPGVRLGSGPDVERVRKKSFSINRALSEDDIDAGSPDSPKSAKRKVVAFPRISMRLVLTSEKEAEDWATVLRSAILSANESGGNAVTRCWFSGQWGRRTVTIVADEDTRMSSIEMAPEVGSEGVAGIILSSSMIQPFKVAGYQSAMGLQIMDEKDCEQILFLYDSDKSGTHSKCDLELLRVKLNDFGARQEYLRQHCHFISSRAVSIIAFDVRAALTDDTVRCVCWWLRTLLHLSKEHTQSLSRELPVVLVGTHGDKVSDVQKTAACKALVARIRTNFGRRVDHWLRDVCVVSCQTFDGIPELQNRLLHTSFQSKSTLAGLTVPRRHYELHALVVRMMQIRGYVPVQELVTLATTCMGFRPYEVSGTSANVRGCLRTALQFIHDCGTGLWCRQEIARQRTLFPPYLLAQAMSAIISCDQGNNISFDIEQKLKIGVLDLEVLPLLLGGIADGDRIPLDLLIGMLCDLQIFYDILGLVVSSKVTRRKSFYSAPPEPKSPRRGILSPRGAKNVAVPSLFDSTDDDRTWSSWYRPPRAGRRMQAVRLRVVQACFSAPGLVQDAVAGCLSGLTEFGPKCTFAWDGTVIDLGGPARTNLFVRYYSHEDTHCIDVAASTRWTSSAVSDPDPVSMRELSCEDLCRKLRHLNLGVYVDPCKTNSIDGMRLDSLSNDDTVPLQKQLKALFGDVGTPQQLADLTSLIRGWSQNEVASSLVAHISPLSVLSGVLMHAVTQVQRALWGVKYVMRVFSPVVLHQHGIPALLHDDGRTLSWDVGTVLAARQSQEPLFCSHTGYLVHSDEVPALDAYPPRRTWTPSPLLADVQADASAVLWCWENRTAAPSAPLPIAVLPAGPSASEMAEEKSDTSDCEDPDVQPQEEMKVMEIQELQVETLGTEELAADDMVVEGLEDQMVGVEGSEAQTPDATAFEEPHEAIAQVSHPSIYKQQSLRELVEEISVDDVDPVDAQVEELAIEPLEPAPEQLGGSAVDQDAEVQLEPAQSDTESESDTVDDYASLYEIENINRT